MRIRAVLMLLVALGVIAALAVGAAARAGDGNKDEFSANLTGNHAVKSKVDRCAGALSCTRRGPELAVHAHVLKPGDAESFSPTFTLATSHHEDVVGEKCRPPAPRAGRRRRPSDSALPSGGGTSELARDLSPFEAVASRAVVRRSASCPRTSCASLSRGRNPVVGGGRSSKAGGGDESGAVMHLTNREIWALVHGLLIGGPFLLAFTGVLVALVGLRSESLTADAIRIRVAWLRIGVSVMAVMAWAIVLTGTWVLLPWYREDTPDSPKSLLLSDPGTRQWHEFADVWKTHVAFMSPILATAAAVLVVYYGRSLARERTLRNLVLALFLGAFAVSSLAAVIGSLVTRAAPIR